MGNEREAVRREALRREALRVHARYASEVIEALNFCPFSAPARAAGRVQTRVLFGPEPSLDETLHEMDSLEHDESAEIGLLVYPELQLTRVAFQHFAARVRAQDETRHGRGATAFAVADFHPDAEPDMEAPEKLVAFIRRSPDPVLQLLRRTALASVRGPDQGTRFVDPAQLLDPQFTPAATEPLHERIARANHRTVQRLGLARVSAVVQDILEDRDRSYARLGLDPPLFRRRKRAE
jgi:hypothetical protein